MNSKENLELLRKEIDIINDKMLELFSERMTVSEKIAYAKRDGNIAISDEKREAVIIGNAMQKVEQNMQNEANIFMNTLIALSKRRQRMILMGADNVVFPEPQPRNTLNLAGYQGLQGAWGEIAVKTMYPDMEIKSFELFEDVFVAVKEKQIAYGVIPIENSQTGAIGEIYDLLRKYGCYIVGQQWVEIRQCLLAKNGTKLEDVREILSHPEGFGQCRNFLKNHPADHTVCTNTAVAAKIVKDETTNKKAAIASRRAAEVNGLNVLVPDIMDSDNNRTRFIAISLLPEYSEQSNTISVTFSTVHQSGALCNVLQTFMSKGINLTRIESRPQSGGKYRFFADLQANILNKDAVETLSQAAAQSEYFEILGCYHD